jgi:hypothetical protein
MAFLKPTTNYISKTTYCIKYLTGKGSSCVECKFLHEVPENYKCNNCGEVGTHVTKFCNEYPSDLKVAPIEQEEDLQTYIAPHSLCMRLVDGECDWCDISNQSIVEFTVEYVYGWQYCPTCKELFVSSVLRWIKDTTIHPMLLVGEMFFKRKRNGKITKMTAVYNPRFSVSLGCIVVLVEFHEGGEIYTKSVSLKNIIQNSPLATQDMLAGMPFPDKEMVAGFYRFNKVFVFEGVDWDAIFTMYMKEWLVGKIEVFED